MTILSDSPFNVQTQPAGAQSETVSNISELAGLLKRRYRTLLAVTLVLFLAALVGVMLITPKYEAVTRIKIDPQQNAMAAIDEDKSGQPDQSVIDTEVSVIRSRDVARRVTESLKLQFDPEFVSKELAQTGSAQPSPAEMARRIDDAAGNVLANLSAARQRATYIVDIKFNSVNADKAARVANAFAEQYINTSVGRRTGTAERQSDWLRRRLAALGAEVQAADAQVARYRAEAGIVEGGTNGTITDQQVAPLSSQLATAEADAAAARSKLAVARSQIAAGGLVSVSGVLNSPVIADLRRQRAELLRNQGEVSTRYGAKHPETVRITQQLQSIEQQIDEEAKRIVGGLESEARSSAASAASLRANLTQLRAQQASNTRSSVMAQTLERQAEAKRTAYDRLALTTQKSTQSAGNSLAQVQVIEEATPPESATYPNRPALLAGALIIALMLGTGTVIVQERLSSGFRRPSEIREQLGIEVITAIPAIRSSKGSGRSPAESLVDNPMTSYAEAFRVVRRSLMLTADGKASKVVALVSTLPSEGKTTSVLSLARVMALAGEKVLLIDCDIRSGGLLRATGLDAKIGLVEVLSDGADPLTAIVPDRVPGLDLLPVATPSFLAKDLLSGPVMKSLLEYLGQHYDRILIDTPPMLAVADARTIATLSDAVLLLIKWSVTPRNAVRTSVSWLDMDEAPLVGAIFTMVDPAAGANESLYYSSQYSQYYRTGSA